MDIFRDWLFSEMAEHGLTIKEVAGVAGIHKVTLSKFKSGDQGAMSSKLLWRFMAAVAGLRPRSGAALCCSIISHRAGEIPQLKLAGIIESASVSELEEAMVLITNRLFSANNSLSPGSAASNESIIKSRKYDKVR